MDSDQITRLGRNISNFQGVFALNALPKRLTRGTKLIVNTEPKNLPGQHWIALHYSRHGSIHAFDPLGVYYPILLQVYMERQGPRSISYNRTMYQNPNENNCGIIALQWLLR